MKMKVIHKNRDVDSHNNSSHSDTSSALVLRPPEPARYQPFIDKKNLLPSFHTVFNTSCQRLYKMSTKYFHSFMISYEMILLYLMINVFKKFREQRLTCNVSNYSFRYRNTSKHDMHSCRLLHIFTGCQWRSALFGLIRDTHSLSLCTTFWRRWPCWQNVTQPRRLNRQVHL